MTYIKPLIGYARYLRPPALATLLLVSLAITSASSASGATSPPGAAGATTICGTAQGPFKDDRTKVLAANGSTYIPYGITVPGLAHADYQSYTASDDAAITATAQGWCSNTVRLQVAQDNLVGSDGSTFSQPFMDAIRAEVSLAESYNLVVVINAQTQDVGHEAGPTHATHVFWNDIAGAYGTDPQVVFDLFNEPHVNAGSVAADWAAWQNGGTFGGTYYLGMQTLLNYIRDDGATNLVWIEGPFTATTLARVKSYPITGGPLMYAIHHPSGPHNSATWWADFGYLVKDGIDPVVDGEWTNYAAAKSECWSDAPTAVPAFLKYLRNHGIGMTAWKLATGVLAESSNLSDPTHIYTKTWACNNSGLDQGAGNQIMNFYSRMNG